MYLLCGLRDTVSCNPPPREGPAGCHCECVCRESPRGPPVRAADLVSRSVMFPEPGRVSELVAALRPAVPPSSSSLRPQDNEDVLPAAGDSTEGRSQEPSTAREEESAEADHQQEREVQDTVVESTPAAEDQRDNEVEDAAPAAEQPQDAAQSAAAVTSSSLADSIVSSCVPVHISSTLLLNVHGACFGPTRLHSLVLAELTRHVLHLLSSRPLTCSLPVTGHRSEARGAEVRQPNHDRHIRHVPVRLLLRFWCICAAPTPIVEPCGGEKVSADLFVRVVMYDRNCTVLPGPLQLLYDKE